MSKETIVTDPTTGGKKGSKLERFDLIPVEPLEELARVYGFGATKYDDDNWKKGYSWKLSFAAMMRHAWAFWRGETYDQESGCHHMAHVAWHCMTLMWFTSYHPNGDCRDVRDKLFAKPVLSSPEKEEYPDTTACQCRRTEIPEPLTPSSEY
jgi:hypothetical protein